jgi:hypothetical protein
MLASELKKIKPKYTENIEGTHCMGNHWTVCCPNKHLQYQRYQPTKEVIQIHYKGGIYRVFVCTQKCLSDITNFAKNKPEQFKKLFIKGTKSNGDLILKHRDTGEVAQIAQKIDTYEEKGGSKKTKKQKKGYLNRRTRSGKNKRGNRSYLHTKRRKETYKETYNSL